MAEIVGDTADQCIPVFPQLDAVGTALVLQDVFNASFLWCMRATIVSLSVKMAFGDFSVSVFSVFRECIERIDNL